METLSENAAGSDQLHTAKYLVNTRGMEEVLVKVGGFSSGGVTNRITYYLPSREEESNADGGGGGQWQLLTSVPHVESCNFGCAVLRFAI